jgi:hypothetical protein
MRTVLALSLFLATLASCSNGEASVEPVPQPAIGKLVVTFDDPDRKCGTALAVIDHDWVVVVKPNTTCTFNLQEGDHLIQYEYNGKLQSETRFTVTCNQCVQRDTLHCEYD